MSDAAAAPVSLDGSGPSETQERESVVHDGRPLVASDSGAEFLSITLPASKDGKKAEWKPGDIVWRPKQSGEWKRYDGGNVDASQLTAEGDPGHLRHRAGVVIEVNEHVALVIEAGTIDTGKNGSRIPHFAKARKFGLLSERLRDVV
jgi:hypothetical protein